MDDAAARRVAPPGSLAIASAHHGRAVTWTRSWIAPNAASAAAMS